MKTARFWLCLLGILATTCLTSCLKSPRDSTSMRPMPPQRPVVGTPDTGSGQGGTVPVAGPFRPVAGAVEGSSNLGRIMDAFFAPELRGGSLGQVSGSLTGATGVSFYGAVELAGGAVLYGELILGVYGSMSRAESTMFLDTNASRFSSGAARLVFTDSYLRALIFEGRAVSGGSFSGSLNADFGSGPIALGAFQVQTSGFFVN